MKPNAYSQRLLESLEVFEQQMQSRKLADEPKSVAQQVLQWTKGQPLLTKSLLDLLLKSETKIARGEEAVQVEKIIRNCLIKNFKQDSLTLGIRKNLYIKNLIRLSNKNDGEFSNREQNYLNNLQKELGLSQQQSNSIREQYLPAFKQGKLNKLSLENSATIIDQDAPEPKGAKSYQDLIVLLENSPFYQELNATNISNSPSHKQSFNPFKLLKFKSLWLVPALLFLVFIVKKFPRPANVSTVTKTSMEPASNSCALNLVNFQSPRLSLGERLLTNNQQNNYLNPKSKTALYAATASFSKCNYSLAQQRFEQALTISKNNPEIRIYSNNAQAMTQEHLKIAVSVPLGNKPAVAWEILRGVAQAQTELNQQGGIDGKLLVVQIVNDNNNPELVRELAQHLADDYSIMAVIGHGDSKTSLAAAAIYQKKGLVMVSPTSSSSSLSGVGSYIMRTTPSVAVLAETLSSYALDSSLKKVAICQDSSDTASASFAKEFGADIEDNGGKIAGIACDFAQEDFNPVSVMEAAVAQDAEALLLAASVRGINQAISLAQANQNRLPLLGSHKFHTYETLKTGQAAMADMVLSVPWLPEIDSSSKFNQDATELWGEQVGWSTAMSYDATQVIIQGLAQASSRQELQAILTSRDFAVAGATGKFQFRQGDRLGGAILAYIGKPAPDSPGYQFLQLKGDRNQQSVK
ncbi:MAG: ABC transporter substrate-binding protein [Cyanobacteria bacterium J06621_8]